jgi:hypothetical protein
MKVKPPTVCGGNERVTHQVIIAVQRAETPAWLKEAEPGLLVQATTSFNFSHHPASAGLGSLAHQPRRGCRAPTTLAVRGGGVPVGLSEPQVWVRQEAVGKRHQRQAHPFAEKESYKWVKGSPKADTPARGHGYGSGCDAGAYRAECLDELFEHELDFVVCAAHARSFTEDGSGLFEAVAQQALQARFSLSRHRRPDRAAREAELELCFVPITLKRPQRAAVRRERLAVWVADVFEPHLVAWKLRWLTHQARQTPQAPCTVALQPSEWQALDAFIHPTQAVPDTVPSLRQAVGA